MLNNLAFIVIIVFGCKKEKVPVMIRIVDYLGATSTSAYHSGNAGMLAEGRTNWSGGGNGRFMKLIVRNDNGSTEKLKKRSYSLLVDTMLKNHKI
jgi:hypothetical protein